MCRSRGCCAAVIGLMLCVSATQGLSLRWPEDEDSSLSDSFPGQPSSDGIPLFMKLLLWDSQAGTMFKDYRQPVLPPSPSEHNRKALANSVAPSRVTIDSAGAVTLEFPPQERRAELESWLVLSLRPQGPQGTQDADLTLALFDTSHRHNHRRLLTEARLPNATFIALDVTKAVRRERVDAPLRLLVDVSGGSGGSGGRAADVMEVAGVERGPLLLRTREALTQDGSMRVWTELPEELVHPPQPRMRRHSRRRPSTTTTEGYSSAESPVRKAATNRFNQDAVADEDGEAECLNCHLVSYNISTLDLKWDFLVFPQVLPINLCVGVCPSPLLNNHYNMTSNAMARSLIKSEGLPGGDDIPSPSCVPIRYTPINVLIRQRNNDISLEVNNDLSAERCGCR